MSRLIWAPPPMHESVWKNPPEVLLASLQPRQIFDWRQRNTWADNIQMIVFTDDVPPREVRAAYSCIPYGPRTGKAPHVVVNAPSEALQGLKAMANVVYTLNDAANEDVDAAHRYIGAVGIVGIALRRTRCAWIQPESDHSIGAIILARTIGFCVGYSQKAGIDSIGALAAAHRKVDVMTLGRIASGAL